MKQRSSKVIFAALALGLMGGRLHSASPGNPESFPLWPHEAPIGGGATAPSKATLTVHVPKTPNGVAMVICPGGGYRGKVTGAEGHGIAQWLNQNGIVGVVLEYRLPNGNSFLPLADAQRAIRTVRSMASEWKVDPAKIGIIGFQRVAILRQRQEHISRAARRLRWIRSRSCRRGPTSWCLSTQW